MLEMLIFRVVEVFILYSALAYAYPPLPDSRTCSLPLSLQSLHTQNPSKEAILQAIEVPGSSPAAPLPKSSSARLAYITPWNGRGYDLAKWHASKFTHIAPVWYQLSLEHNKEPKLNGRHDVDESWLKEVKAVFRPPKILPRVQMQFSQKAAEAILYYPQGEINLILETLLEEVERFDYDGLTIELPHPHAFKSLVAMIGEELHAIDKKLILVVPPIHSPDQAGQVFAAEHVEELEDMVDYFSVMTYDHSVSLGVGGPNAPLPWMRQVVEGLLGEDLDGDDDAMDEEEEYNELDLRKNRSAKILLGLPFYGYKISKSKGLEAYTASNYVEFLKDNKDIISQWDEVSKEHRLVANYGKDNISILWYPSLLSLLYRLQLAEEMGTGISIWELGQGLDQFLDVL